MGKKVRVYISFSFLSNMYDLMWGKGILYKMERFLSYSGKLSRPQASEQADNILFQDSSPLKKYLPII